MEIKNEENKITYLKASLRSKILDEFISFVRLIEKIKTLILPIKAATIPLPPSRYPYARP